MFIQEKKKCCTRPSGSNDWTKHAKRCMNFQCLAMSTISGYSAVHTQSNSATPNHSRTMEAVLALYTAASELKKIDLLNDKWHQIAQKYAATKLDPAFAVKFASDYTGMETATGQSLAWGVVVVWPILRIPELHTIVEKFLKHHEDVMMGEPGKEALDSHSVWRCKTSDDQL